jgi:hypothetical protein
MASQHMKRSLWRLSWRSYLLQGNSQFSLINAAFLMSRTSDCTPLGSSRRIQSLSVCSIGSFTRMELLTPLLMPYPTIQLLQLSYRPSQLLLRRGCLMSLPATKMKPTMSNCCRNFQSRPPFTLASSVLYYKAGSCLARDQNMTVQCRVISALPITGSRSYSLERYEIRHQNLCGFMLCLCSRQTQ